MPTLAQEQPLTVNGKTYTLSRCTLPIYEEFLDWCRSRLPDPFEGIADRIRGLPDHLAKHLIDKAEERAARRGSLTDPEVQAVAESLQGVRKMYALLFRKHQPGMTDEQVLEVVEEGIAEHGQDFFRRLFSEGDGPVKERPGARGRRLPGPAGAVGR